MEGDIQNWMRYVHRDRNADLDGIVALAMQCAKEGNNE
jgi:hypothetical protein